MYDFSKVINRRGTHAYKWDRLDRVFGNPDLLAMWVADMDWETPSFIKEAIINQVQQTPALGYTCDPDEWWPTVLKWIKDHHQWDVQREWITYVPGIVRGIGMVVQSFLKPGDKVIVQPPVYHPFFNVPRGNKYEVVWNPLIENLDAYSKDSSQLPYIMDFDDLERKCDDKCRLLILANPHNPVASAGIRLPFSALLSLPRSTTLSLSAMRSIATSLSMATSTFLLLPYVQKQQR